MDGEDDRREDPGQAGVRAAAASDNDSYDRSGSLGVLGTARALPLRLGVQSEEHDHRAGGRGESDGAAGELAP